MISASLERSLWFLLSRVVMRIGSGSKRKQFELLSRWKDLVEGNQIALFQLINCLKVGTRGSKRIKAAEES